MPSAQPQIFPFSSVWIGDFGDTAKLTRITCLRTGGVSVVELFPTKYEPSIDNTIQSGNWTVRVNLTFYLEKTDEVPLRVVRGLTVAENVDDVPRNSQYSLLLVPPDASYKAIYLPKCRTESKGLSLDFSKVTCQSQKVTLIAESRSVLTKIVYRNTPANLAATLGSTYPL